MAYLDDGEQFSLLVGKTLTKAENIDDEVIYFKASDGSQYELYHDQDCCERVMVDDICGDLADLLGSPILSAEEATSDQDPPDPNTWESVTWTFYKLATVKGSVTIRWCGRSNGYYSESVEFRKFGD